MTSWERWLREIALQSEDIALETGCPARTVQLLLCTVPRLEGGWGAEPGIGDRDPSGGIGVWTGGPAYGWPQFNIGFVAGRSWQPEGRGLLMAGWDKDDLLNEKKVVAYWGRRLALEWLSLGDIPNRERITIGNCEKPYGWSLKSPIAYGKKAWQDAWANAQEVVELELPALRPPPEPVVREQLEEGKLNLLEIGDDLPLFPYQQRQIEALHDAAHAQGYIEGQLATREKSETKPLDDAGFMEPARPKISPAVKHTARKGVVETATGLVGIGAILPLLDGVNLVDLDHLWDVIGNGASADVVLAAASVVLAQIGYRLIRAYVIPRLMKWGKIED